MKLSDYAVQVAVVAVGVYVAGFFMNQFRDVTYVRKAIDGFDS